MSNIPTDKGTAIFPKFHCLRAEIDTFDFGASLPLEFIFVHEALVEKNV